MSTDYDFYCPRCQIGRCSLKSATYTRLHNGMIVSVPDMPAYLCDVCGYQEFDGGAMSDLIAMLEEKERTASTPKHSGDTLDKPHSPNPS